VLGSILMRGGKGGEQNPSYTHLLFPLKLEGFGGEGRRGKLYYHNFNYIDIFILIFILKYQNYPYLHFFYIANLLIFQGLLWYFQIIILKLYCVLPYKNLNTDFFSSMYWTGGIMLYIHISNYFFCFFFLISNVNILFFLYFFLSYVFVILSPQILLPPPFCLLI
jgi:hypothetical protein